MSHPRGGGADCETLDSRLGFCFAWNLAAASASQFVTRHTARRKARINELSDELTVGAALRLRKDSDDIRLVVEAVVAYLIEEYPAQDLYVPSSVTYPAEQIRADVAAGLSIRKVCQKHCIGRKTLYRLLDTTAE